MSKSASLGLAPSANVIGRLMVHLDRLLMASAQIAVRNCEPPHLGL